MAQRTPKPVQPTISMIVAVDLNWAIGKDGGLLFRLPEDMKHFVHVTTGKPVIMGRKTYESIPAKYRPLDKGRTTIVLTRGKAWKPAEPGAIVVHSVMEAIAAANEAMPLMEADGGPNRNREIMVAGGAEVYQAFLPHAARLYVTCVTAKVEGADAFFPNVAELAGWRAMEKWGKTVEVEGQPLFTFYICNRERRDYGRRAGKS